MYNIGGIFVEYLGNVVCVGTLFVFTSLLSFECLAVYFVGCRPLWCIGLSHMAESSVKVLQTVGFMLFLYQRDLGGPCRNHSPGVVWLDNLRDCLGSVRIPLARNPCGRRHLKKLGLGIVKFRYQRWLSLNIRIVIAFCRPCMPLFVFLSAVGLHTSGLEGVAACERQWRTAGVRRASSRLMAFGYPVRVCASRLVWVRGLCHLPVGDVECVYRSGSPRV